MAQLAPEQSHLFRMERQREIADLVHRQRRVEVSELALRFGVTTETIRRDLSELQRKRILRRVHGGAIPWESSAFEPEVATRSDRQDAEKRRLAAAALAHLPSSGGVLIDSGSTLCRLAEAIPETAELRVITNSLMNAHALADHADVEVVVIGGRMRRDSLAMVDAGATQTIRNLTVDTAFISADGLSPETGLSTPSPDEAELKRAMIASANHVVALVDHSKFGLSHLVRYAEWTDIDVLITDRDADPSDIAAIESTGTVVDVV